MRQAASSMKEQLARTRITWAATLNRIPERIEITAESIFSWLNGIKISLPDLARGGNAITVNDNTWYYPHHALAPTIPATTPAARTCSASPSPAISTTPKLTRSSLRLERV